MATLKIFNPQVVGKLKLPSESASKVLTVNASGDVTSSTVTLTELALLSGVTSALVSINASQTLTNKTIDSASNTITNIADASISATAAIAQSKIANLTTDLAAKEATANKGVANGYASLDSGGKVPVAQLPNSIMEYQGTYNASTNTPTLVNGTGNTGDVYRVTVAGAGVNSLAFVVGDYVIYNGTTWEKAHSGADTVISVNGSAGAVTVNAINQLTSDVTTSAASGSQSLAATVASVGGQTAANVAAGAVLANAATNLNTVSAIVKRDASGNFTAGTITAALTGNATNITATSNSTLTTLSALSLPGSQVSSAVANATTAVSFSGSLSGDVTGTQSATAIAAATVTGKAITGFVSGAGTVTASDSILTAINKLDGNISAAAGLSGDINNGSFAAANNVIAATNVTGFAFAAGTVRSFRAVVSVSINATTGLNEVFDILGIQKSVGGFDIAINSAGDDSGVVFSITSGGQIQYTSANSAGFVSNTIKFRAQVTNV